MNGKYIFRILLEARESFEAYLYDTAAKMLPSKQPVIREILDFLSAAIIDFRSGGNEVFEDKTLPFRYNILEWRNSGYKQDLEKLQTPRKGKFLLYLPEEQRQSLKMLLKQYEHKNRNVTLRKMSEFMDIRDFFRKVRLAE